MSHATTVLPPPANVALADIETTPIEYDEGGVIIYPKTVHVLVVKDFDTKDVHIFGPDPEDIRRGVRYLETCKLVVFHNGRGFDEIVLRNIFDFKMNEGNECLDSFVLCCLFYSNIKEEEDFRRFDANKEKDDRDPTKFTGDLIGSHSLEAWGLRLQVPRPKGEYTELMRRMGIDPWAAWNQDMQDYCVQDVEVLEGLWGERLAARVASKDNKDAIAIEHYIAELMMDVKASGIHFDKEHADKLAAELEARSAEIERVIQSEFPPRLEPVKWVHREIPIDEPDLIPEERLLLEAVRTSDKVEDQAKFHELMTQRGPCQRLTALMWNHKDNDIYRPRFNLPEGYLREQWGDVFVPKVTRAQKDKEGNILYVAQKDCPMTKVKLTELNPGSRTQVIRRLLELGWIPEEFTDSGIPSLSETELNKIVEEFPAAKNIALYMVIQKRLGALKSGDKAWMNLITSKGIIHPTIKPCNAVTFRATHSDPNISQVPSVKMKDVLVLDADGKFLKNEKGDFVKAVDEKGKVIQKPLLGEKGKWGYECRECFTVPNGWAMVGSDLAGIELRAWAHYLWQYDQGRLADIVLNKDVHEENRVILGFQDRRKAKEWLYAMMYGGGDEKLGFIIDPLASPAEQKALGRASRSRFMTGMIGYEALNHRLMLGVRQGYLPGLDGRRCPVRKQHAALNTLLQSAGAIISKYWIAYTMDIIENEYNLKWGYDNDFTLMIYSHDELDFACLPEHSLKIEEACIRGAKLTRTKMKFKLPIDVGVIHGKNWAECH